MKTQLIMMGIYLLIGGYIGYSIKPDKECPEIAGTSIGYVEVPAVNDSLPYTPVVIPKQPKAQKVNVDSIYQVAKKYWERIYDNSTPVDFVAKIDSNLTTQDSVLTGSIAFVSRIPLDPIGYFKTDLSVRQKTVTNTIIQKEEWGWFHKRFVPILGVGVVYTWDGQMNLGAFLGLGVRLN